MNTQDKQEKGLQKMAGSRITPLITEDMETRLAQIVKGGKIDIAALYGLSDAERDTLKQVLTTGLITLAGEDRGAFFENIDPIISDTARNEIWDNNHKLIMGYVDQHTRNYGKLPTVTRLAHDTGLSRVTITKHLKEYYSSPAFKEKEGQIELLRESLLMKVYGFASEGDMKAARLFLDATSGKQVVKIKTQNNYVQNNTITITEDQLKQLPQKQQAQLLKLIRGGNQEATRQAM